MSKSKRRRTESRSQRRARSKSEVKVHDVTAKRECITTIKLQIYKKHEHPITVTFDFNTKVDRAEAVSAEMVRELALPDRYRLKVQRAIAAAIDAENGQQTQVIGHSIVGSPTSSRPRSRSDAEPAVNDPAQSTASSATPYPPSQREGAGAVSPPPPSVQPAAQPVAAQSVQSPVDGDGVELDLKPLAAYLSAEGVAIEIDDKSRSEIARRRDELLREFKEFRLTKQELLNLKEESSLDAASRTAERRRFEDKMKGKKSEIEEQWKNFIDDYKDIAEMTSTKMASFAQIVLFEQDAPFRRIKGSALSDADKYRFEAQLKQYRTKMVADYMSFYAAKCSHYAHLL